MLKTIFFLHSAGKQDLHEGSNDFVSWLRSKLGKEYKIEYPIMPNPDNPDYEPWAKQLRAEFKQLSGDVILVGHSVGGSVLIKYLTENRVDFNVKALLLCATPFWGIDDNWQYEPFALSTNFADKLQDIEKISIYHSKDDAIVELKHAQKYKKELPSAQLNVLPGNSHAFENGIEQLAKGIEKVSRK
jgi:uncharacterized protein